MTYALPDEPRGAIRPDLAVGTIWPMLTLMLVGPLIGFAWLAFNSWALGCRHAVRHSAIAVAMVLVLGFSGITFAALVQWLIEPSFPENARLAWRLMVIALQGTALSLALWIVIQLDDAENWRKTFGAPLGNGMRAFFILFLARVFGSHLVPGWASPFVFWLEG